MAESENTGRENGNGSTGCAAEESNVRVSSWIPNELHEEMIGDIEYPESKSEWIRDAIRMRVECENHRDEEL